MKEKHSTKYHDILFTQQSYQFFQGLQRFSKILAGIHLFVTIPVEHLFIPSRDTLPLNDTISNINSMFSPSSVESSSEHQLVAGPVWTRLIYSLKDHPLRTGNNKSQYLLSI